MSQSASSARSHEDRIRQLLDQCGAVFVAGVQKRGVDIEDQTHYRSTGGLRALQSLS
jgi:hypothetical protein